VRGLFLHRRKFLRSQLISTVKPELGKEEVDALLTELSLSPSMRAEELTCDQILMLGEAVRTRLPRAAD
jgi:16S rRNA (adenine1518-N6/adenine1519-N6)-dimethyltransferase